MEALTKLTSICYDIYKITYIGTPHTQTKTLIPHSCYIDYVKPILDHIHDLECNRKDREAKRLKRELKAIIGDEYFTDASPLWLSQFNNNEMTLNGKTSTIILEKLK